MKKLRNRTIRRAQARRAEKTALTREAILRAGRRLLADIRKMKQ